MDGSARSSRAEPGDGQLGRHELCDLHGLERRACAQVVVADEESQPAIAGTLSS